MKTAPATNCHSIASLNADLFAAGFSYVTTKKVLGGFYGVSGPVSGRREQPDPGHGNRPESRRRPDRLRLRAAFNSGGTSNGPMPIASYSIFAPTGPLRRRRVEQHRLRHVGPRARRRHDGLPERERSNITPPRSLTFDFQSKKEDSETKVGNAMNLEGGVGGDFLKGGLTAGLAYYAAFKITDDQIRRLSADPDSRQEQGVRASGPKPRWRSRGRTRCTASCAWPTTGKPTRGQPRRAARCSSRRRS